MTKFALILHGFPQPVEATDDHLIKYLQSKGYEVCCPYLLAGDWDFNWLNIKKYVDQELKDKVPDVVIGISMGGLFLPNIVKDWPNAKLIFIASGASLHLPLLFKLVMTFAKINIGYLLIKLLLNIPDIILIRTLSLLDRWIEGPGEHDQADLQSNIKYMRLISKKRIRELIDLLKKIDNSEILTRLQNPALVINGSSDVLMGQGSTLASLLSNCKYIENTRSHFNVFTKDDLKLLDEYL